MLYILFFTKKSQKAHAVAIYASELCGQVDRSRSSSSLAWPHPPTRKAEGLVASLTLICTAAKYIAAPIRFQND